MCPSCVEHGACTDAARCQCPCRTDAPQLPTVARDADATPADRAGTVAPKLAARPAVVTSAGSDRVSEGDGDAEAVRDLLGPPVGSMPGVQRIVTEADRAARLGTLVEAYRRGAMAERAGLLRRIAVDMLDDQPDAVEYEATLCYGQLCDLLTGEEWWRCRCGWVGKGVPGQWWPPDCGSCGDDGMAGWVRVAPPTLGGAAGGTR